MRCVVFEDPATDELAVSAPPHLLLLVKGHQCALYLRQAIERHSWEVVMLEMVVGVQEGKIPEPVPAHERSPLRRIGGIDIVVLPQTIQRERDGENEEHRDDARP